MKTIRNKLLLAIIAIAFIATSFTVLWQGAGTTAFASDAPDEKQFSAATIEDNFADDRILVVMDKQSTMSFRSFSTADFSEIGVASVDDLTRTSRESLRTQIDFARVGQATRRKSMEITKINSEQYFA